MKKNRSKLDFFAIFSNSFYYVFTSLTMKVGLQVYQRHSWGFFDTEKGQNSGFWACSQTFFYCVTMTIGLHTYQSYLQVSFDHGPHELYFQALFDHKRVKIGQYHCFWPFSQKVCTVWPWKLVHRLIRRIFRHVEIMIPGAILSGQKGPPQMAKINEVFMHFLKKFLVCDHRTWFTDKLETLLKIF